MKVALLQLDYPEESRERRVARVRGAIEAAPDADLLVLPELWDVGYFAFDEYAAAARSLEESVGLVADLAVARHGVLVAGSVLERDGDRLHNTVLVIGPDGSLLGRYRKAHLFGNGSRESELLTAGDGPATVTTPAGVLGLATCFDLRFPRHFAELRRAGADLVVVPAAWPAARAEHWQILTRARAIETQTPMVAVNGTGPCCGVDLAGRSVVLDARGAEVVEAGTTAGWHRGDVEHADTVAWRDEFPIADDLGGAPVG